MGTSRNSQRRSVRLKGYNYSQPGAYFITICTKDKIRILGNVEGEKVIYSPIGKIAEECWLNIPNHFPDIELDQWIIMPNHIHGIIFILDAGRGVQLNAPTVPSTSSNVNPNPSLSSSNRFSKISPSKGSLAVIIRTYKAAVTRECRQIGQNDFGWQRGYYDRIIRSKKELDHIRRYIEENPLK
jgi:REP element-mobilizing transposase RayT